jgi:Flp pilus assembly protein TadG
MRTSTLRSSERGAALVESALVFLLFFVIFVGTMDFSRIFYYHQTLTERARAAARYAAIHPTETAKIKNIAVFNREAATDGVPAVLSGLTTAMVQVANQDINTASARVIVTIADYPMDLVTPMLSRTIRSKPIVAVMAAETQVP